MDQRTIIGICLALMIIYCLWYEHTNLLFLGINLALIYDIRYMLIEHKLDKKIVGIFLLIIIRFNIYLYEIYDKKSYEIIKIAAITQTSDVYQYLAGKYYGKNKIGWISKNKTIEGYIVGNIMTIVTFVPIIWVYENTKLVMIIKNIEEIYILGIIGGLCSSLFKRIIDIKDYSNLLGPHGGWIDRIDSIILPLLVIC